MKESSIELLRQWSQLAAAWNTSSQKSFRDEKKLKAEANKVVNEWFRISFRLGEDLKELGLDGGLPLSVNRANNEVECFLPFNFQNVEAA
jgi:hypothetical protein